MTGCKALMTLVVILFYNCNAQIYFTPGACNLTMYTEWKNTKYEGRLAADPTFWMYQTQPWFVLTNGLALELAIAKCKNRFQVLYTFKSGRSGPIDIQHGYKAMCSAECLESDNMHEEAMYYTGCSCKELSTQPGDVSYHLPGDWCLDNSARMLCSIVGYCGIWDCRFDDFMCPRFEWNKKLVPFKGTGDCIRGVIKTSAAFAKCDNFRPYLLLISIFLASIFLML